jgi:hypothetical protein
MTSFNKMKKHPIDELFQQKLEKYEVEVSEELKARFLAQVSGKDKKTPMPFRWYYTAAAILVIGFLAGGYLINSRESQEVLVLERPLDIKPKKQVAESQVASYKEETVNNSLLSVEPKKEALPDGTSSKVQEVSVREIEIVRGASLDVERKNLVTSFPLSPLTDEHIPDQLTLALQTATAIRAEKEQSLSPDNEDNNLFRRSAGETIIIVAEDFDPNKELYLPELNHDSRMTIAEVEHEARTRIEENKPVFSKFLAELRKLKYGEKVDLNTLIAQNEDNTGYDENTFLGHEAEEMRQRINWIRGKFSK